MKAANPDETKYYFEKAILEFTCGDIEVLVQLYRDKGCTLAGPLLLTVAAGIDTLAGMVYGFGEKSGMRSKSFMKDFMNYSPEASECIYSIGRCGVSHQAAAKAGMGIYLKAEDENRDLFFKRSPSPAQKDILDLNVVRLAADFQRAVRDFQKNSLSRLLHLPDAPSGKTAICIAHVWDRSDINRAVSRSHSEMDMNVIYGQPLGNSGLSPNRP